MSEEILREIIGLTKRSNWNKLKNCIKFIVQKTYKKKAKYKLTVFNGSIKGKKKSDYNTTIENEGNIKTIDTINDFKYFSLYQSTPFSNNLIEVSQNNGTLVFLAKYMGPSLDNYQVFDFAIHLDALNPPFFTNGTNKKLNGSDILKVINHRAKKLKKVQRGKSKPESPLKKIEPQNIEAYVFEKITGKNAIWSGSETKAFKYWKAIAKNKYRKETGKITHYKAKPTHNFTRYLKDLLIKKEKVKRKSRKKSKAKKRTTNKKKTAELTQKSIFEKLTGKNAIWNGKETKNFQVWKTKIAKKYKKETEKNTHYGGKLTQGFRTYLSSIKIKN
jgi:hypothetical protein